MIYDIIVIDFLKYYHFSISEFFNADILKISRNTILISRNNKENTENSQTPVFPAFLRPSLREDLKLLKNPLKYRTERSLRHFHSKSVTRV